MVRRAEPARAVGTGVIKGRVVAADTGNPIRRANVNLTPIVPPSSPGSGRGMSGGLVLVPGSPGSLQPSGPVSSGPRQATTNSQGAFEFTGLPAGSYRIFANANQFSPQYLGMAFGGKKPMGFGSGDTGQPIQLGDGQSFDKAIIALPRGGVITGRVTDENGEPVTRVQVYTILFPPGSSRGMRMGSSTQTDDLGQFRIYGLQPGDHAVVAEGMRNTFVPPNAPPETEEDKIGFVTTYYPGTADEGAAQRVRARVGTETPGIEIRLLQDRLYRISGSRGRFAGSASAARQRSDDAPNTGHDRWWGIELRLQHRREGAVPDAERCIGQLPPDRQADSPVHAGPGPQADPGEMASLPLTIAGADLENVMVMTTPGVAITGQVVFEQGPPSTIPGMPGPLRVMATVGNPDDMAGLQPPQPAVVKPDLTFAMKGLLGEFLLRASAPRPVPQISHGGQRGHHRQTTRIQGERSRHDHAHISRVDGGRQCDRRRGRSIDGGRRHSVFGGQSRVAVQLLAGQAISRRPEPATSSSQGLLPGRYLIVAVPRERLSMPPGNDTAIFEELSKVATALVIGEDEERKVDLKIVAGSGGQ